MQDRFELSRVGRVLNTQEMIQLEGLVTDAIELTEGRLQERGVQLPVMLGLPVLVGDRKRLLELLQNLNDNDVKYMGTQLNPWLRIGQDGIGEGHPKFFVRDNGIGIELKYQDQIFGLFNKLDSTTDRRGSVSPLQNGSLKFTVAGFGWKAMLI